MEIKTEHGKAYVYTPYNPDFVRKIKNIGGAEWDRTEKCWIVPEETIDAVRIFMDDIYGYTDIKPNDTITLQITCNEEISEERADIMMYGKVIAQAFHRDSGAKIGSDAVFVQGGATSGGSAKYWDTIIKKGSVIILSNVNKNIYEKTDMKYNVNVEILKSKINRQQLLDEKERLLKRIEEINSLLQENI